MSLEIKLNAEKCQTGHFTMILVQKRDNQVVDESENEERKRTFEQIKEFKVNCTHISQTILSGVQKRDKKERKKVF